MVVLNLVEDTLARLTRDPGELQCPEYLGARLVSVLLYTASDPDIDPVASRPSPGFACLSCAVTRLEESRVV